MDGNPLQNLIYPAPSPGLSADVMVYGLRRIAQIQEKEGQNRVVFR